jgi:NitT/TauT family transport system ATP-binding protein
MNLRLMSIDRAPMSFLAINQATYAFQPSETVVDSVEWTIDQGEFHCLVGRSGCGKTTLLKVAAGLLQPTAGSIFIDGMEIAEPSAQVGFVFQTPTLLEWQSVSDNILLPISLRRTPSPQDRQKATDLLALVGLAEYAGRYPRELSGGQQSRVAIARALINEPAVLLLDEPFAALDAITREELQDDLLKLCALHGTTVLFVTHDIAEAIYLADRVAVMEAGRLRHDLAVDLAKPRQHDMRYSPHFNTLCLEVRQAMDEAA